MTTKKPINIFTASPSILRALTEYHGGTMSVSSVSKLNMKPFLADYGLKELDVALFYIPCISGQFNPSDGTYIQMFEGVMSSRDRDMANCTTIFLAEAQLMAPVKGADIETDVELTHHGLLQQVYETLHSQMLQLSATESVRYISSHDGHWSAKAGFGNYISDLSVSQPIVLPNLDDHNVWPKSLAEALANASCESAVDQAFGSVLSQWRVAPYDFDLDTYISIFWDKKYSVLQDKTKNFGFLDIEKVATTRFGRLSLNKLLILDEYWQCGSKHYASDDPWFANTYGGLYVTPSLLAFLQKQQAKPTEERCRLPDISVWVNLTTPMVNASFVPSPKYHLQGIRQAVATGLQRLNP